MEQINAAQLRELMDRNGDRAVINVLDEADYREMHIPGSENVPVSSPDFVDRVKTRVRSRKDPVVVYCASRECDASEKAAEKLEKAGFTNVVDYAAGIQGWKEAGFEFARS
jgi:rhodanese-related sulfurtransferase